MNIKFEKNVEAINEIIDLFELPDLTEARGKELYDEGKKLLEECFALLEASEGMLEEVYLEGNKVKTRPLIL